LDRIFEFLRLLHAFQQVKRRVFANGEDRLENDAEHSYQLAMAAWYLIESGNLPLDKGKAMRYALVHDLVEVYAGDTYVHAPEEERRGKAEREAEALKRLEGEFPECAGLFEAIHMYEKREDAESRFVYALDKAIVPMNLYLDGGRTWRAHGVTFKMVLENKTDKVKVSPEIEKIFYEVLALLETEKDKLFPV